MKTIWSKFKSTFAFHIKLMMHLSVWVSTVMVSGAWFGKEGLQAGLGTIISFYTFFFIVLPLVKGFVETNRLLMAKMKEPAADKITK